jgi:diaminopimelate epimerase
MKFTKLHGTGNDFLVIDARYLDRDWAGLAASMCATHTGVGADGILLIKPSTVAALRMVLYNADGSEAEMSGNGMRCFVKHVVEHGLVKVQDNKVRIETLAGVLTCGVSRDDHAVTSVRVAMGRPRFRPDEVPVAVEAAPPLKDVRLEAAGEAFSVTCLSMGNPHAVLLIDDSAQDYPLERVGPAVEQHTLFPKRVNFGVTRVIDRGHIESRVWERGVGETLSCGTGVSAAMVAARLHGLVGDKVEAQQPGGTLTLEWDGEREVFLTGPAVEVFQGEWPE